MSLSHNSCLASFCILFFSPMKKRFITPYGNHTSSHLDISHSEYRHTLLAEYVAGAESFPMCMSVKNWTVVISSFSTKCHRSLIAERCLLEENLLAIQIVASLYRSLITWFGLLLLVNGRLVVTSQQLYSGFLTVITNLLWEWQHRIVILWSKNTAAAYSCSRTCNRLFVMLLYGSFGGVIQESTLCSTDAFTVSTAGISSYFTDSFSCCVLHLLMIGRDSTDAHNAFPRARVIVCAPSLP